MSNKDHFQANASATEKLAKEITEAVLAVAYPLTVEQLWELTQRVFPIIGKYRRIFYDNAVTEMRNALSTQGLEISPAAPRAYSPHATWKMIARLLGWDTTQYPLDAPIEAYPDDFRTAIDENVVKPNPTALDHEKLARRVVGAARRHAASAGRDVVVDSARFSEIRDVDTEEVLRPSDFEYPTPDDFVESPDGESGVVVGWARVLTGEENCPFCAMLASRGPVYEEKTALNAASRDGRRYHDNCDCTAVMVVKGKPWDGQEQYEALQDLWYSADSQPTDEEIYNGLLSTQERFYHRYRREQQIPPHPGITLDQNEKGSAVVIPPDVLAEVDDGGDRSWLANMSADIGAHQPESHEWKTFIRLAQNGHHVHLRKVSDLTSPDVWLDGVLTECKAPKGGSKNTIANNFKEAKNNFGSFEGYNGVKQVVLDCNRCPIDSEQIVKDIQRTFANPRYASLDQVIILLKNGSEEVLSR